MVDIIQLLTNKALDMYRILTEFRSGGSFQYMNTEKRLHNDELNLVVKSFKFDAVQLSVSMVIYRIRLFMSLCTGLFSRHD